LYQYQQCTTTDYTSTKHCTDSGKRIILLLAASSDTLFILKFQVYHNNNKLFPWTFPGTTTFSGLPGAYMNPDGLTFWYWLTHIILE